MYNSGDPQMASIQAQATILIIIAACFVAPALPGQNTLMAPRT